MIPSTFGYLIVDQRSAPATSRRTRNEPFLLATTSWTMPETPDFRVVNCEPTAGIVMFDIVVFLPISRICFVIWYQQVCWYLYYSKGVRHLSTLLVIECNIFSFYWGVSFVSPLLYLYYTDTHGHLFWEMGDFYLNRKKFFGWAARPFRGSLWRIQKVLSN